MASRSRPRIADVAREAGVSKTTVSFTFNSPERVRPETAARIRQVATDLGYKPHAVARMLARRETHTIGVVTPQALSTMFLNPFFATFSAGVARAAEEHGYGLHFIAPFRGSLASAVDRAGVDGVVTIGLSGDHPEVEQIRAAGLPMVLVDSTAFPGQGLVDIDDEAGARLAAEHVAALGHRRVLVIGVEPPDPATQMDPEGVMGRRLRGYRAGLSAAGIDLPDHRIVVGPASLAGGRDAFRRAWDNGCRPTAVLAMSDAMAIGAVSAARGLGLRVPEHLSVVGFDDIDVAAYVDPPLTTVRQPMGEKGAQAVTLLLAAINRTDGWSLQHRRLTTEMVVRASSAPAPRDRKEVDSG